jgi:hypothetical protein
MPRPYKPFIPKDLNEIIERLNCMIITSPTFVSQIFPNLNIDTEFYELNEGLRLSEGKLGQDLYLKLRDMSDQMRALFEADPEDKTDDSIKGREIILAMVDLIK